MEKKVERSCVLDDSRAEGIREAAKARAHYSLPRVCIINGLTGRPKPFRG
jgi:hypothetical protein